MSVTRFFSEVREGGTARNNPVPLEPANYKFTKEERRFFYHPVNVIVFHRRLLVDHEVTGMARLDSNFEPMTGPNDLVYLPCPEFCNKNDVNPRPT